MLSSIPLWMIIAGILILAFVILFKTMNQVYILSLFKKHAFWFVIIPLLIFLAISLTYIHSTYDIDFTSLDGFRATMKIYLNWLGSVFSNIAKVTGFATKQDWITNSTG